MGRDSVFCHLLARIVSYLCGSCLVKFNCDWWFVFIVIRLVQILSVMLSSLVSIWDYYGCDQ